MSFFSTFSEISRNKDNFKQWEQDEADIKAKREQYLAQNPASEQDLKQARRFGRVVIDTVDFMDTQSEDKAESVEMATDQAMGLLIAPLGFILPSVILLSSFNKHSSKLTTATEKATILLKNLEGNEQNQHIVDDLINKKIATATDNNLKFKVNVFQGHHILDKNKFDKLEETTKAYFRNVLTDDIFNAAKNIRNHNIKATAIYALVGIGLTAIGQVVGTILQVKASRVARYQAREALKDPKNFVEYTDEQREEVQKNIPKKNLPKEKIQGSIKDIKSLLKDYGAYQAESEKLSNTHLYDIEEANPSEAYKKQKIINESIKKINNTAEEYSENMETAAGVILGSSVLGGALFGKIAGIIIKKIDAMHAKKAVKNVEEFAKKEIEEVKPTTGRNTSRLIWTAIKSYPGIISTVLATLIAMPLATKLQKESARAGRYKAKRELEENPQNFIYVEQSDIEKQTVKGEVKKDGVLDVVKFIPQSIKTIKEYEKYKKTEMQKRRAELEALKTTEISGKQFKTAENLQTRLYKSFDTIDDHSQEYSEKMEAACEIAKDIFGNMLSLGTMAAAGIMVFKYPQKTVKLITSFVSTIVERFKGFTKKYVSNIGKHSINKLTAKIKKNSDYKILSSVEKEIDEALNSKTTEDFTAKMATLKVKFQEKRIPEEYLRKIEEFKQQNEGLEQVRELMAKPDSAFAKLSIASIKEMFIPLRSETNPDRLREMFNKFAQFKLTDAIDIIDIDFAKTKDKDILKIKNNLISIIDHVPEEELAKAMEEFTEFQLQRNTKTMIMQNHNIGLNKREIFLTKDIAPLYYSVGAVFIATMIGLSYSMESYLAGKTKQAGRLGTMKAIQELDKENDEALEMRLHK